MAQSNFLQKTCAQFSENLYFRLASYHCLLVTISERRPNQNTGKNLRESSKLNPIFEYPIAMIYRSGIVHGYSMIYFRRYSTGILLLRSKKSELDRISQRCNSTNATCKKCQSLRILYFGSDAFSIGPLSKLVSRMRSVFLSDIFHFMDTYYFKP